VRTCGSDEGPPFVPCTARDLGEVCVDLVFMWGPTFKDQLKLIKGLMNMITPQVGMYIMPMRRTKPF